MRKCKNVNWENVPLRVKLRRILERLKMKVYLHDGIKALKGRKDGMVYYGFKNIAGLCFARIYVYPTITEHNVKFGAQAGNVAKTWKETNAGFKYDMQIYVDAWNEMQHCECEPKADLNAINLFVKGCFAVAKKASFDLSTLTVKNFGGKPGDLMGTTAPNAGNLIAAAGMPACGLDLTTLTNPIVAA
jgi:hypothetical protein